MLNTVAAASTCDRATNSARARQVGCEQLGKLGWVEIGEPVRRLLDRTLGLGQDAGHLLAELALVLADVGGVRGDIDQARDVGMNPGLGDDRAAIAVADEQGRAVLQVEKWETAPLCRSTSALFYRFARCRAASTLRQNQRVSVSNKSG